VEELEDELRRKLKQPPIDVPSAVDRAVLANAARGAAVPRPRPQVWKWVAPLVGTAAAAAAAFFITLRSDEPSTKPGFDIVDAYRLSLQVADGSASVDSVWDMNQDGRVDELDVRRVAQLAVSLGETRGS
jgi:hypothetical protein